MRTLYRIVRWAVLVSAAWAAVVSLPGIARYIRMRQM